MTLEGGLRLGNGDVNARQRWMGIIQYVIDYTQGSAAKGTDNTSRTWKPLAATATFADDRRHGNYLGQPINARRPPHPTANYLLPELYGYAKRTGFCQEIQWKEESIGMGSE